MIVLIGCWMCLQKELSGYEGEGDLERKNRGGILVIWESRLPVPKICRLLLFVVVVVVIWKVMRSSS